MYAIAIVDVCEFHHAVNTYMDCGDLNREKHTYKALLKATDDDLKRFSKVVDYIAMRERLQQKYG